jgi:NADP-dependent 3-hydroxy acid dehydrogenase YdfG
VVFGARNSGAAIAAERLAAGWSVLAVARSEDTLRTDRNPVLTPAGDTWVP